jgi:hypothetical protein
MRCIVQSRIVMFFAAMLLATASTRAELLHVEIKTLGMD